MNNVSKEELVEILKDYVRVEHNPTSFKPDSIYLSIKEDRYLMVYNKDEGYCIIEVGVWK